MTFFFFFQISVGSGIECILGEDGRIFEKDGTVIPFPEKIIEIVACYQHIMAVSESYKLYLAAKSAVSYGFFFNDFISFKILILNQSIRYKKF